LHAISGHTPEGRTGTAGGISLEQSQQWESWDKNNNPERRLLGRVKRTTSRGEKSMGWDKVYIPGTGIKGIR